MKNFTESELHDIYNTIVKLPPHYFTKNELVPACPIKSWNYRWSGHDFPRVMCVLDFKEWIAKHKIVSNALGYTGEGDPELEFLPTTRKMFIEYPPHDLHVLASTYQSTFDFFLFSQTLEHLHNPFLAIANIFVAMKPGGYVFTSVPTINIPHSTPIHYGGLNPMGLTMLFKSAGFDIVEIGQWGNYEYIQRLFATHSWPDYDALHHGGRVRNEEVNVCQCWILARKPM
jgi:hypothetical protein